MWRNDRRTEWQTKQTLNAPLPFYGGGIKRHNLQILVFIGVGLLWIRPSTKTTKIGTPRNWSHPQYKVLYTLTVLYRQGQKFLLLLQPSIKLLYLEYKREGIKDIRSDGWIEKLYLALMSHISIHGFVKSLWRKETWLKSHHNWFRSTEINLECSNKPTGTSHNNFIWSQNLHGWHTLGKFVSLLHFVSLHIQQKQCITNKNNI